MAMEPVREGELHPLQNCYILEMIFKELSLGDLKTCRQVCKEWCRESSAIMRRAVPVLTLTTEIVFNDTSFAGLDRILDFMELMKRKARVEKNGCSVLPFKVELTCHLEKLPREFWGFCGSRIAKMDIRVHGSSGHAFRHAVFQSCVNLEELEILVLGGGSVDEPNEWVPPSIPPNPNLKTLDFDGGMMGGVSWMEILSHFPGLEKFDLRFLDEESIAGFFASLALARRHEDKCWKIKHLLLNMRDVSAPLAIASAFEDMKLPLRTLVVDGIHRSESLNALRRILGFQASTLMDLCLIGYWGQWGKWGFGGFRGDDPQVMQVFPVRKNAVFEKVTRLCLEDVTLTSVSFLQSFPCLMKLVLQGIDDALTQYAEEPAGKWTLLGCKELKIDMNSLSPEGLRRLLSGLPNMEELDASLCTNDRFAVICELLPKLVYLDLPVTEVNDVGISGLSQEDVARINENGEEGGWWPSPWMARPNISRLKNLQRLCMSSYHRQSILEYTSIIHIRQLPQLQHLSVERFSLQPHDIWDRLLTRLRPQGRTLGAVGDP